MPGMTDLAEVALLNHTLGVTPLTFPTNIWGCYLTTDPTDAGLQTSELGRSEIVGGFNAASGGLIENTALETVDTTGWTPGTPIAWFAMAFDGVSGAYYWTAQLTNPITFTPGEILEIDPTEYKFRLTPSNTYAISDNARNKWLEHLFGRTQWTISGTPEVRLHDGDPGVNGDGNEFTGGGYAPEAYTLQTPSAGDPTTGTHSNAMQYLNSPNTTLDYWTIHRGTDFMYGRDQADRNVNAGATIDIPAGRLIKQVT